MMNSRALLPVFIFTVLLVMAIVVGNAILTFFMQRPIDEVPNFLKFIVHGISLSFIAVFAKKYFLG